MIEEYGWVTESELKKLCADCDNVVREGDEIKLASCEYGQPWFPAAPKCRTFDRVS